MAGIWHGSTLPSQDNRARLAAVLARSRELKRRRQWALGPEVENELALKRDAGQFSDRRWSGWRSHPARRSTHQTAKPIPKRMTTHRTASQSARSRALPGVSFMAASLLSPRSRVSGLCHIDKNG